MITSYLLAAWQNLMRQKFFALINILGLAIGFCVFTLISLYVNNEYSYDKQWENADRIYLLSDDFKINEQLGFKTPSIPFPAGAVLKEYFPDTFEHSNRRLYRGDFVLVNENRYEGGIHLVERGFVEIFNFDILAGSLENTLASSGNIALTESQAILYFGEDNPIGQTISLNVVDVGLVDYQVSAVFKIPEGTSSLRILSFALLDEASMPDLAENSTNWASSPQVETLVLLKPGLDIDLINQQLDTFVNQYIDEPWRILDENTQTSDFHHYEFQAYNDLHFDTELQGGVAADKSKVLVFSVIGILVLMIGTTNFVILTTAKAEERRREVGVRKVLGANRQQLVFQFIGESVLLCLIALMLALFMTWLFAPFFSTLIANGLPLTVFTPSRIGLLFMVGVIVGVLGGLYPAFVLASFDAVKIFKPFTRGSSFGSISLRNVLVTFQFSIAIMLIIMALVLYMQLSFYKNRDLGFNPENLLTISLNYSDHRDSITPLTNELRNLAGVEQVGLSSMPPNRLGSSMFSAGEFIKEKSAGTGIDYSGFWVGYNYFDVYGIPLIAGRVFDPLFDPLPLPRDSDSPPSDEEQVDVISKIVINRFLSVSLGFNMPEDAVGKLIYEERPNQEGVIYTTFEIIGVVEDSHYYSLREKTEGERFELSETSATTIGVRFQDSVKNTINQDVEKVWRDVIGETPIRSNFVSQNVDLEFFQEENDGKIVMTFSLLAIFVSCVGLYGLASFTIKSKIKEVGIRKVLGANSRSILGLFIWQFSKPVLVAMVIASPITLWLVVKWLQRFPDQIEYSMLPPIFIFAGLTVLLIACITVASTTSKAAKSDPVKSLRYE